MSDNLDIVTIGESLIELSSDVSFTYADTLKKYYGGDTLTAAIAALRLGSKTGYISKVGNDAFKDYLLESWQQEGLDISQVKIIDGINGVYFISIPSNSQKEFSQYRKKTAATYITVDDINENYIKHSKIFYASGVVQSLSLNTKEAVLKAYKTANKNGVICAYASNYSKLMWAQTDAKEAFEDIAPFLDVFFLNLRRDAHVLFEITSPEKIIKSLWDRGIRTVSIKSSEHEGFYTGFEGEVLFEPYFTTEMADTTGAGDAYNGAFLHSLAHGMSPFEAMKVGAICSGLQSGGVGAVKSIPYRAEVYKYLKR